MCTGVVGGEQATDNSETANLQHIRRLSQAVLEQKGSGTVLTDITLSRDYTTSLT
jgi:hypothetical protein